MNSTFSHFWNNRFVAPLLFLLLFLGIDSQAQAVYSFASSYVNLTRESAGEELFTCSSTTQTARPSFSGSLGNFDLATSRLILNGGQATTTNSGGDVRSLRFYYRVYKQGTTSAELPTFTSSTLLLTSTVGNNKTWSRNSIGTNLLSFADTPDTYVLEVYYEANGTRATDGQAFSVFDGSSSSPYRATFNVTSSDASVATKWNGKEDSNWFNSNNWSNGVPTGNTDAILPTQMGTYPEINKDVARVYNLTLEGTGSNNRSLLRIVGGELRIYGNLANNASALTQEGGTVVLAGGNQEVNAGLFTDLRIEGGGIKRVGTRLDIQTKLVFVEGIVQTLTTNPSVYSVDLRRGAVVVDESETSYVLGVLRADRTPGTGRKEVFGNIGVDLTFSGANPGTVFAVRYTGQGAEYLGQGTSRSILRAFNFTVDGINDNLNATMVFHYLDSELNNQQENRLVLFRSANNGTSFGNMQFDTRDAKANTLTKNGINSLMLFTLNDNNNPLPVTLTSFVATQQGQNALISWATAQEVNNAGFEVQVSTDAMTYRTLGTVRPAAANTTLAQSYRYLDTEAGKAGLRYYRLRQLDLDGTEHFSQTQTLAFNALAGAALTIFPNPVQQEANLLMNAVAAGTAAVRISNTSGQQVGYETLSVPVGSSTQRLAQLEGLPSGLYMVHVTLPGGQSQFTKIAKQ